MEHQVVCSHYIRGNRLLFIILYPIVVVFPTVVFVMRIAEICMVLLHMVLHVLHMGQQLQSLSFPHQLLFKKVVLKTCDSVHYFRAKNG